METGRHEQTSVNLVLRRATGHLDLGPLAAQATAEGLSFVARTTSEWDSRANRFDRPGEVLVLAEVGDEVVGMCGLNIDPFLDDPSVGRLRHLYVAASMRRMGVGGRLVAACLRTAELTFTRVRLRTFDPMASAFYLALGFAPVDEPDATHAIGVTTR